MVFHCALSQQRGPSAALRYLREKDSRVCGTKVGKVKGPAREDRVAKEESEKGDVVEAVGVEGEPQENQEAVILQNANSDAKPKKNIGRWVCQVARAVSTSIIAR